MALVSIGLALGATPLPTFAKDFYVGTQDDLAINQGGYSTDFASCCSLEHSAQCKVQALSLGGDRREQGTKNRTRDDSSQGSVVTDYNLGKEMLLVPGSQANSSHAWACAQYSQLPLVCVR